MIIGILLIVKVFLINLFSSQILSITIKTTYVTIDSIEELTAMKKLEPVLFAPEPIVSKLMVNFKFFTQLNSINKANGLI